MYADEPAGIRIGQRPEQHAVDHGEHHGGRPDAESQCQYGDRCKQRFVPEGPKRIAEILPQILQPARAAGIAAVFPYGLCAAQAIRPACVLLPERCPRGCCHR